MKNIFLFIIFFFNCDVYAQQWEWARKADGTASSESPKIIRSDGFGNLYLFGGGNGGSKYGNTIMAPGDFIVKFNSSGAVIWAMNINFTGSNTTDFNVDSVGNIYFVGQYYNSLNVLSFNFISNGQEDIYIIKLDPLGTPLWGRSFGGIGGDSPGTVAIDNNENVYIDGNFRKSISFDTYTLTDTVGHFFLTKLNSSGNTIWATKGDASFWTGGQINLDKHSNIYVVGYTNDCYGYFIAKFDSSGNLRSQHLLFGMYDYVPDFVVSDSGNIFLLHNGVGHYGYVPILVKYDSLMNEQWSRGIGTYYGCYQFGTGVFIDKFENIYVGGSIGSTFCSQDSIYFQNQLAHIGHNGVPAIVKFSSSGNFIWIKEAISTDYDGIWTMSQDKSGNLYAAGIFNYPNNNGYGDTLIFDNYTLIDDGNWQQIFVAKLNQSATPTSLILSQTHTNVLCNGQCTGSAILTAIGGTPPYNYNGLTSGLCAGLHSFNVIDSNGNSATTTVTITQPIAIAATATATSSNIFTNSNTDLLIGAPLGGTFSGIGVSGTNFDPSVAGVGTWTITYTYTDGNGCTDTATTYITVDLPTGRTVDGVEGGAFEVYPNPTSGIFTINLKNNKVETKICVYDASGNYVLDMVSLGNSKENIDLTRQPKGIYTLEIESVGETIMKKIILQ